MMYSQLHAFKDEGREHQCSFFQEHYRPARRVHSVPPMCTPPRNLTLPVTPTVTLQLVDTDEHTHTV